MSYDADGFSMSELFRLEVETQIGRLNQDLLALEKSPDPAPLLESLMRAAHSTKGAARLVGLLTAERLAHAMEDYFVAAQEGRLAVEARGVDCVLRTSDLLLEVARLPEAEVAVWESLNQEFIEQSVRELQRLLGGSDDSQPSAAPSLMQPVAVTRESKTMRLAADRLDALVSLSGEAKVLASWLGDFSQSLLRLKTRNAQLQDCLLEIESEELDPIVRARVESALRLCHEDGSTLFERLDALNEYERRVHSVSARMFDEVLATRMRPFADGVQNLQRLVRDLGRDLGKEVVLELEGLETLVDREILERLEAPLTHLLRNSVDHGIEPPGERLLLGKPARGRISVVALHRRGWLFIQVSDDGRGLDAEAIRNKLVERQLSPPEVAARLSPEELSEFIFLPGFSSRSSVTEISGRGVGLDLVRQGLGEVGGQITCELSESLGVHFEIQLPLALNILQCLLVEVARQTYALPLARLDRVAQLSREQITTVEGRPWWAEENMCLTLGTQILGFPNSSADAGDSISVVSFHHHQHKFGLVVDRLLGKQKLVSQRIDARLGKLQHVASGAILQDGSPALILDVEDLVSSMAKTLENWQQGYFPSSLEQPEARKRVLVVDDSITVREVERNLLQAMGYQVDVAVDGVDGWNAVRAARYDLVVSDIDMPRMDGFELVKLIKADPQLASLPILIVSYKDREEDKLRGLEAGADGYLTKASFHDHKFAQAVRDLIG